MNREPILGGRQKAGPDGWLPSVHHECDPLTCRVLFLQPPGHVRRGSYSRYAIGVVGCPFAASVIPSQAQTWPHPHLGGCLNAHLPANPVRVVLEGRNRDNSK